MRPVHRPIDVEILRDRGMVIMRIDQHGSLTIPPRAAHAIARELMRVVGEIESDDKNGRPLPFL